MIISNNPNKIKLNQINYDKIVNSIDLQSIICDQCGHNHWHIHGRYLRIFSFLHHSMTIKIVRILCSHCRKTHAIFLEGMVPFSSLVHSDIIRILISPSSDLVASSHFYYLKDKYDPICFYYLKDKYDPICFLSYRHILDFSARNLPLILLPT